MSLALHTRKTVVWLSMLKFRVLIDRPPFLRPLYWFCMWIYWKVYAIFVLYLNRDSSVGHWTRIDGVILRIIVPQTFHFSHNWNAVAFDWAIPLSVVAMVLIKGGRIIAKLDHLFPCIWLCLRSQVIAQLAKHWSTPATVWLVARPSRSNIRSARTFHRPPNPSTTDPVSNHQRRASAWRHRSASNSKQHHRPTPFSRQTPLFRQRHRSAGHQSHNHRTPRATIADDRMSSKRWNDSRRIARSDAPARRRSRRRRWLWWTWIRAIRTGNWLQWFGESNTFFCTPAHRFMN